MSAPARATPVEAPTRQLLGCPERRGGRWLGCRAEVVDDRVEDGLELGPEGREREYDPHGYEDDDERVLHHALPSLANPNL